jgi:hypothetical protein
MQSNKTLNIGNALAILAAAVLMAASLAGLAAQEKADEKKYNPSEVQSLRLKVKQRDAQVVQTQLAAAQQTVSDLQQRAQSASTAFNDEVKAIAKENGWPETIQVKMSQTQPDTIVFYDAPAPPAPPKPADPQPPPAAEKKP